MKSRFAIGLVVVLVLIAVVVVVSRMSAPEPETQQAGGKGSVAADGPESGPARTKSRAELNPDSPETPEAADEEPPATSGRKMWDQPADDAEIHQAVQTVVKLLYTDLIKGLNLNEEEAGFFKTLLGKGYTKTQELGFKMREASEEERQALVEEMTRSEEANDKAIREFLNNDEDFQRYTDYKDRLPERQQIGRIRATMSSSKVPLDDETADRLMEAMHRVRKDSSGPDFYGPDAIEEVAKGGYEESFMASWEASQEALRPMVSNILNPEQLEAFQEYQKQMRDMKLKGLKTIEKAMKDPESGSE